MTYGDIQRPFAVVTVYDDGSGVDVSCHATEEKARAWIEHESEYGGHERVIVSLPALLAWVRGSGK